MSTVNVAVKIIAIGRYVYLRNIESVRREARLKYFELHLSG